jgi:hypothetical protein
MDQVLENHTLPTLPQEEMISWTVFLAIKGTNFICKNLKKISKWFVSII